MSTQYIDPVDLACLKSRYTAEEWRLLLEHRSPGCEATIDGVDYVLRYEESHELSKKVARHLAPLNAGATAIDRAQWLLGEARDTLETALSLLPGSLTQSLKVTDVATAYLEVAMECLKS